MGCTKLKAKTLVKRHLCIWLALAVGWTALGISISYMPRTGTHSVRSTWCLVRQVDGLQISSAVDIRRSHLIGIAVLEATVTYEGAVIPLRRSMSFTDSIFVDWPLTDTETQITKRWTNAQKHVVAAVPVRTIGGGILIEVCSFEGSERHLYPLGICIAVYAVVLFVLTAIHTASCMYTFIVMTKERRRGTRGECVQCGYNLSGLALHLCPECGATKMGLHRGIDIPIPSVAQIERTRRPE